MSNRQNRGKISASNYHQQRKGKSKTSKGHYKSNNNTDKSEVKSSSKTKKRKVSKRNRSSNKAQENAQTPISMSKLIKNAVISEFTGECDSLSKHDKLKIEKSNQNSDVYKSQLRANIQELIDSKVPLHASTGVKASYSPYVSNNLNQKKSSQRSKSTNPHVPKIINNNKLS